jgi:hypothetical protein
MCLDPHARAKIEMREAIESLERVLLSTRSTNPKLSEAGLVQLARLKHRLRWCDESHSRRRSQLLLMWVAKLVAEVAIRVLGASFCFPSVAWPQRNCYDDWRHDQAA